MYTSIDQFSFRTIIGEKAMWCNPYNGEIDILIEFG